MAEKQPKESTPSKVITTQPTILEQVQKLLELVSVKKVFYVDDANKKDIDVEVFLGKIQFVLAQENAEEKLSTIVIEDVEYTEPYEIISKSIRAKWAELNPDQKLDLMKNLNKALEDKIALLDYTVVPRLKDFFPENLLFCVDPFEWEAMLNEVDRDLNEEDKILLLFDYNLKDAGGKFQLQTGVDLIINLKGTELWDKVICALLSNEISLTDLELYYREKIMDEYEGKINYIDFFPLAKQRLYEPEAGIFADGIKKTFINRHFEVIKDETKKVIIASHEKVLDRIKKMDTYDFDDAVIKTSAKEGVWEIETLIRITQIIQTDELYQSISDTQYPERVNPEIKEALKFNDINFKIPDHYKPYSEKVKLRHKELYQSGDLINKLHKTIENGDIFELDEKKYILVAQPCDLMVRGKGSKSGKRNAKFVTLLRIKNILLSEFEKKVKKPDSMQHYLSDKHGMLYLNEQANDIGIALFNEYITVDVDILDTIVYNSEGKCRYVFPDNDFNLNLYNTAWEDRFTYIKKKLEDFKKKVDFSFTVVKEDIENRKVYIEENFYPKLILTSTSDENFVTVYDDNSFDFGIKRISNYKNFNAAYLLDRYTRFQSRTAELHDFAQKT